MSPFGWNDTTLGKRRRLCSSASTCTRPPRTHATTVFVVPRSMPTTAIWKDLPHLRAGSVRRGSFGLQVRYDFTEPSPHDQREGPHPPVVGADVAGDDLVLE